MKKYIVALAMLVATTSASAHELQLDLGLGAFDTEGTSISQVKLFKLSLQEPLWRILEQRFNIGGWQDIRPTMSSAGFTSYQVGLDVRNSVFESSVFFGPGLISATDPYLGGYFQFNVSVFVGFRDAKTGVSLGIDYNHFSSAGLEMPNQGKDFLGLGAKFQL